MKILDPGHYYRLNLIDEDDHKFEFRWEIRFVKRIGEMYPGNTGQGYSGTNIQDVLRVLINRTQYLQSQIWCWVNPVCILLYRLAMNLLEYRAATRHHRKYRFVLRIERMVPDVIDGHIRF